jgi:recombination protein RecR
MYPEKIQKLIDFFSSLPGVGPKTAAKYAFDILHWDKHKVSDFTNSVLDVKNSITTCTRCYNYSDEKICSICSDRRRNHSIICVVAFYPDLLSIEALNEYNGHYHILRGTLNPLEGITPDRLTISKLIHRIERDSIEEIILALNPDIPGESTSLYLSNILKKYPVKITRLAKGLPMGATLEYADHTTISNALKGRQAL